MASEPRSQPAVPGVHEHEGTLEYPDVPGAVVGVRAQHRNARERTVRAARTLAVCWALAVVAVFLPLIHFVLVPGLLVLGPVLAWSRLHEGRTLLGVDGPCPACGAAMHVQLGQPWRERTVLRCDGCGRRLILVLPDVSDAETPGTGKLDVSQADRRR